MNVDKAILKAKSLKSFSDNEPFFDNVLGTMNEIARLEAELESLRDDIRNSNDMAEDVLPSVFREASDNNVLREVASLFYWVYPFNFNVIGKSIKHVGIRASARKDWLCPLYVESSCGRCGKKICLAINSKAQAKEIESSRINKWLKSCCDECIAEDAARSKENDARSKDFWARRELERTDMALHVEHLKTMPYREYLQTQDWKIKRMAALKRARFVCELCSSAGILDVHHKTYERRGCEDAKDLIVLCRSCHSKFHDKVAEVNNEPHN